ncbi:MAG TPA: tannase/feruloyl esterase family alpha/beta hydrolase, partial [Cryptosporangiaceae bacterium]|nr:tannase/feruloyl esterase family alpha/beta hydrolase [Cryptosporangiaceae bacterium]
MPVTARTRPWILISLTLVLLAALAVVPVTPAAGQTTTSCEDLAAVDLAEVTAITSEVVPAGEFTPPGGGDPITELPELCRVALTVDPQVNIEVWLPTTTWNERFQAVGGGGYAGSISYSGMAGAVRDGYATASTDTGHVGGTGDFALNDDGTLNWQLIEDFAYRSLHQLTLKAKALIEAYYGQSEAFAYWNGCSTGGRQGLMEAQRFPDDYDGILAGAPAINWDRFHPAHLWPQLVMQEELGGPMDTCKLEAATAAAVEACDELDGVADGVLEDPRDCDYDPHDLVGDELECGTFTEADAEAIRKIWQGPQTTDGEQLWYGLPRGAPLTALAGSSPFFVGLQHAVYWVNQDPSWDWTTLTYETYEDFFTRSYQKFNTVIGTDNPDLSGFRDSGGKVLIWHGWSDPLIFPQGTIDYYERVLDRMGGLDQVEEFARLFLAPGVGHCRGGVGPNPVDLFDELVEWVEDGDAPEALTASLVEDGEVVRTRPLCTYPDTARYTGKGSTDEAASFLCGVATPTRIGGTDRYATAVAAANEVFPDGTETAVVATGEAFPDALAASALAAQTDAALLLTGSEVLPDVTADALDNLGVSTVYVIGGQAAVSDDVVDLIDVGNRNVTRIGGNNRYETAALVAARVAALGDTRQVNGQNAAFLTTGANFADAVTASAAAAAGTPTPVLLTRSDRLSDVTREAIDDLRVAVV